MLLSAKKPVNRHQENYTHTKIFFGEPHSSFLRREAIAPSVLVGLSSLVTMSIEKNDYFPPFAKYDGDESFFGGQPPLPQPVGYIVVLVFGSSFFFLQ